MFEVGDKVKPKDPKDLEFWNILSNVSKENYISKLDLIFTIKKYVGYDLYQVEEMDKCVVGNLMTLTYRKGSICKESISQDEFDNLFT